VTSLPDAHSWVEPGADPAADRRADRRADPPADNLAHPEAPPTNPVIANPWHALRRHTPARIALGRAGIGLPTAAHLDFQLAHAQARDAVHRQLDVEALRSEIEALGLETVALHSAAADRATYLQRPDLGRKLAPASTALLQQWQAGRAGAASVAPELAVVVVDGLSSLAVQRHAVPLLAALLPLLRLEPAVKQSTGWCLAPVAVVTQGRVAVGDPVGEAWGSQAVVVLIGERPGLSSPDSLGIYLTWAPKRGRSDAQRNCISNVRPEGLDCHEAATRLAYLLGQARQLQLTGVGLKDERHSAPELDGKSTLPRFLIGG